MFSILTLVSYTYKFTICLSSLINNISDSVIYVKRPGGPKLETGPMMGDLAGIHSNISKLCTCNLISTISDEIGEKYGVNTKITEFGAAGPKSYVLMLADRETGKNKL